MLMRVINPASPTYFMEVVMETFLLYVTGVLIGIGVGRQTMQKEIVRDVPSGIMFVSGIALAIIYSIVF